jgi:hypothetical protein
MFGSRRLNFRCCAVRGLWLALLAAPQASAGGQHEFLFLPSIDLLEVYDESSPDVADSHVRGAADLLYSYSGDNMRLLGEYLLSTEEAELERLQLGWVLSERAMLWVGRFHSPASFWISEFHHGQYLQTSITRPSLEEWEDENGAAPSHVTGVNLEFEEQLRDESSLGFSFAAGLAPKFVEHELVAFDMLDPRSGHGLSLGLRTSYRPDMFAPMQIGFLTSWNEINVVAGSSADLAELDRINQLLMGVYADVRFQDLRVIASAVYHDNELRYLDEKLSDSYLLAYVQPEYSVTDDIIVFGRVDIGDGEDDSLYLDLLPSFLSHRNMLGVRWDFSERQSLTVEVADSSRQGEDFSHEHFKELRVQWSAVLR